MAEIVVDRPPRRQSTMVMTPLSRRVEHALERFETFGSVALEHRRLEFDCCGAPVGGLQHTHGEEFGAFGVDVVSPVGEELAMRVNAHTQRPVFGH